MKQNIDQLQNLIEMAQSTQYGAVLGPILANSIAQIKEAEAAAAAGDNTKLSLTTQGWLPYDLAEVAKTIAVVDTKTDLDPLKEGQEVALVKGENVIYKKEGDQWKQIIPDADAKVEHPIETVATKDALQQLPQTTNLAFVTADTKLYYRSNREWKEIPMGSVGDSPYMDLVEATGKVTATHKFITFISSNNAIFNLENCSVVGGFSEGSSATSKFTNCNIICTTTEGMEDANAKLKGVFINCNLDVSNFKGQLGGDFYNCRITSRGDLRIAIQAELNACSIEAATVESSVATLLINSTLVVDNPGNFRFTFSNRSYNSAVLFASISPTPTMPTMDGIRNIAIETKTGAIAKSAKGWD